MNQNEINYFATKNKYIRFTTLIICFLLFLVPFVLNAQVNAPTNNQKHRTISGNIVDPSGGPLPGAIIRLKIEIGVSTPALLYSKRIVLRLSQSKLESQQCL